MKHSEANILKRKIDFVIEGLKDNRTAEQIENLYYVKHQIDKMRELPYKTSRDMGKLKELLDQGYEVVCFITYDADGQNEGRPNHEPVIKTDICTARYNDIGSASSYIFEGRGTSYINYSPYKNCGYTLLELLKAKDIRFIEPTLA